MISGTFLLLKWLSWLFWKSRNKCYSLSFLLSQWVAANFKIDNLSGLLLGLLQSGIRFASWSINWFIFDLLLRSISEWFSFANLQIFFFMTFFSTEHMIFFYLSFAFSVSSSLTSVIVILSQGGDDIIIK